MPLDPTEQLKMHIEFSAQRDKLAKRAIDLLAEGNDEEGMEAASQAEFWDLKVRSLEP